MARSSVRTDEQRALAMSDAAARAMEEHAASAGLSWPPAPFASSEAGSFADRLSANPFLMAPMASVTDSA